MNCPDCGGSLRCYRTYHLSETTTRHYRRCVECGSRWKADQVLVGKLGSGKGDCVEDLTRWGVDPGNARSIAEREPATIIREYSRKLPSIILDYQSRNGRQVNDPAGFLVWVISNRYPIPSNEIEWHADDIKYRLDSAGRMTMDGF